jgi:serine/threonine protein kinase
MKSTTDHPTIGRRLGDFEVVREVGRGGMGIVYEARQVSLNRKVALKVLAAGLGLTGNAVQRFHREAEAAAKLHHTNIVPVYAVGEQDGTHFYAMELIQGPSLDHVLKQLKQAGSGRPTSEATPTAQPEVGQTGPYVPCGSSDSSGGLTSSSLNSGGAYFDAAARMIADVADALEYAHRQGVIHRDIKPSNLLLSPEGRLSLNDFGLARVLEQPGLTTTGELVGTPAYMSPEQITAGRVPLDHRTDIYSLGATLYELLTLQPPFTGPSRDQVLAQIIQKGPPRPRRLKPNVPKDLETICLKCLEKDPDQRYPAAKELADDLRRYVNRFAIRAKRPGPLTRLKKWVKRNPALSVSALVILLAAGAAGYFAWHAFESEQRVRAEARKRDEEVRAEKQRAAIDRGMVAAMAADLPTARAAIAEAEALGTSAGELHVLRGFVALYSGDPLGAVQEFGAAVEAMPESVAARALLSIAHGQAGDWAASDLALKVAEKLPPRTTEDRLFLGLALSPFDSPAAVRELSAAVGERPSGIGHILFADGLCMHAAYTRTVSDAEAALDAAETASRLLPRNPYVEVIAVNARLAAAEAYQLAGEPQKAGVHYEAASRLAGALSGPRDSSPVIGARFAVAESRDGITPPLRFTQDLWFPPRSEDPDIRGTEVVVLWRLGKVEKARERLTPLKPTYFTAPLKVALALEQPGGRPAARDAWADSVGEEDGSIKLCLMIPWLYLTGEPERAPVMARKLRRSGFRYRGMLEAEWESMLRFWEDNLTEAEFLKAPSPNRMSTVWRYMIVGMKRLGEGDREGARTAFTAGYELRAYSGEWEWCYSFLIRMNTDSDWPKAIPVKKKP